MKKQVEVLRGVAAFVLRYQVGAESLRSLVCTVHVPGDIAYSWVVFLKSVITQVISVSLLSGWQTSFFFFSSFLCVVCHFTYILR